ncbi:hypothetical protein KGF56_001474 [Candida oxycetoniae]|uniref:Cell wall mannoprotein PIR1-like C-terminal domain-containing protein n=1 Tax=Candida oxycetoniae TaxID=497107 RepID=A0AAI9T0C0_9ASCO|nr:uncharacterized protein KGF56_001474 [Candida oxycetoniae]KAI3405866.1 hypothetical protein KGF56_001474 [Candida oxycetoniae]
MHQLSSVLLPLVVLTTNLFPTIKGYYVPASGEDWTNYKPSCDFLPGSLKTLPFSFGIVVNPYIVDEDGDLKEPKISSIARSLTTTVVTSFVTPAPKPTKTKDIILQIQDGQVQKVNEELYDENCPDDKEKLKGEKKKPIKNKDDNFIDEGGLLKRDNIEDESSLAESEKPNTETVDEVYEKERKSGKSRSGKHGKKHRGDRAHNKKHREHNKKWKGDQSSDDEDSEEAGKDEEKEDDGETSDEFVSPVYSVACYTNSTLRMTLKDSVLRDSDSRIGCIVSGHQFQFDGPVPQHGAVFAAGWSVTKDGQLALGNSTKFYQCASGHFYNLYDQPIAFQCHPVTLDVVELIEC